MAWRIEFTDGAERQFGRLTQPVQKRIRRFLIERAATRDDWSALAKPLQGRWLGLHRFRIGAYRVIVAREPDRLVIVVVAVGHRGEVYD